MSEIYFHQQCSLAYFNDDVKQACHSLKEHLCGKMLNVSKTLNNFKTSLCKKRDRMLKKRNETISEIKNYYSRLRELLLSKLQRDEEDLLNLLKDKVDNQNTVILEKIQQCCASDCAAQEKRSVIENLEHLCESGSTRNNLEYIKNLVNVADFVKECEQTEIEVADVRDGFLLIRFFVNSETEQTVLTSKIACVEVLNSRSENQDSASLESERISEVTKAVSDENETAFGIDDIELSSGACSLRVALPPLDEQNGPNIENEKEHTRDLIDITGVQPQEGAPVERVEEETPCPLPDQISDLIDEFDIGLGNRSNEGTSETLGSAISNEMILSNIRIEVPRDVSTVNEAEDNRSNECDRDTQNVEAEQTRIAVGQDNVSIQSGQTDANPTGSFDAIPQENESVDAETASADRRQSVAETETSGANIPRVDDPPPPYPGLLSPEPPGPDELPPPYPGTGPPPPYSQNQVPEAQQPSGRGRLNGESGRNERLPRPSSESDFRSGSRDNVLPSRSNIVRLSRPKVSKVFSVNEANDRRVSGIFAVASVRGNAFLVVDRWNKKLKYFSENGVSYGGLIFREEPWDITEMIDDLVAVTVPKLQTFYKIKVTDNSVITTSTVPTLRSYSSIVFSKVTQVFVCSQVPQFGEAVVDIIGINGGQLIQSFRSGFTNELVFSYPRYVRATEDGIVIICDWNLKCLLMFKLDGSVVGRYRGTADFPLNEPTGIAYNSAMKEIYVIDAKHTSTLGALHIVNLNCRCKEIVRWDNEFRVARAITPHKSGYALGNKSGVLSLFAARQRR